MLTINNYVLPSPEQWEVIIDGMRNPMNSWEKSDSRCYGYDFDIGDADLNLMRKLSCAGTDHAKFRRMIPVYFTITAPLYWWKEFDTYKVGTTANSCSTMHKIHANPFTLDDFSCEHLTHYCKDGELCRDWLDTLDCLIDDLNVARDLFLQTGDKKFWWQLIQLLPSSYNQRRTVALNYEVLANIYRSRRNHKLTEWHTLCDAIKQLPYATIITGEATDNS